MKHLINYKIFESSINTNNIIDMILSDLDGEFDINDVYAAECSYRSRKDGTPYIHPEISILNKSKPLISFLNKEVSIGKKMDNTKYTSKGELRKIRTTIRLGIVIMVSDKNLEDAKNNHNINKILGLLNRERFNNYNLDFDIFKKPYNLVDKVILIHRIDNKITESNSDDDYDMMARYQLFGSKAQISFNFNTTNIYDNDEIKKLIKKYKELSKDQWVGGPPSREWVDYWNSYIATVPATLKCWKPTLNLKIETINYGSLIVKYSVLSGISSGVDTGLIEYPINNTDIEYNRKVYKEIKRFVMGEIYGKLTINDTIDFLNLKVDNLEVISESIDTNLQKKEYAIHIIDDIKSYINNTMYIEYCDSISKCLLSDYKTGVFSFLRNYEKVYKSGNIRNFNNISIVDEIVDDYDPELDPEEQIAKWYDPNGIVRGIVEFFYSK